MITSTMLSDEEKAGLKRYYIDQFWNFVRKTGAEVETKTGKLTLIMNSEHMAEFIETFTVDDDPINCKVKDKKIYVEARNLMPASTKDDEILAGREKKCSSDGCDIQW